ncbi:hypothetical protein PV379_03380 [Streptomyces caniscabiei]|uniref:hypothetical protein n=1 Tax=Streptomyces caniscabiei TaxID=2746961 RepID=UPI0029B1601F|nr:hypothetical protein [Streptomyces caniscabiei]MDX2776381.1 hypothetical protein [Streptomyces caniscabiei]
MKAIRNWILALLFVASTGGATLTLAVPQTANAACNDRLLTFPAWFRGLTAANCDIESPNEKGIARFIWKIVLNIVEFMLQLVAYISVGYIITGGFKYMTSSGSPDGMTKAKRTITNAIVGLVISIFSVAIVNVVVNAL